MKDLSIKVDKNKEVRCLSVEKGAVLIVDGLIDCSSAFLSIEHMKELRNYLDDKIKREIP
jgi:hypothetical protein